MESEINKIIIGHDVHQQKINLDMAAGRPFAPRDLLREDSRRFKISDNEY